MYVELHSRSAFSFLEGASIPEELVAVCANLGMPAMALLDRDGVYGSPRFHLAAKKAKIKAHIGAEVASFFSPQRHRDAENNKITKTIFLSPKDNEKKSSVALWPCGETRLPLLVSSR